MLWVTELSSGVCRDKRNGLGNEGSKVLFDLVKVWILGFIESNVSIRVTAGGKFSAAEDRRQRPTTALGTGWSDTTVKACKCDL